VNSATPKKFAAAVLLVVTALAGSAKDNKSVEVESRAAFKPRVYAEDSLDNVTVQRPAVEHEARRAILAVDHYDPANPDRNSLQRHDEALAALPKDPIGFPDWMRALKEGTIQPRMGLHSTEKMNVLNLDIIMKNTKDMPNVRFPHYSHTLWLDCSNCHPQPFEARAGSTQIAMADIFRGKYCGMCHDRVAFITFFSCQRCHSVPQARQ
jgi:c(7)-type cytochrome triheme protein